MRTVTTADRTAYRGLDTAGLRRQFLVEELFKPGAIELVRTDVDRAVVGGAVPLATPLTLPVPPELRAKTFCERRELGILNLGGAGSVSADSKVHQLGTLDLVYLARGTGDITLASADAGTPAQFYLLSYPAHAVHPTVVVRKDEARRVDLGTPATANRRTIRQYVHPDGAKSCQLVMGWTELHEGSVWNTFPPHTHDRRTEVYCYFDLPQNGLVMHFMGEPTETRHLIMREKQVALSPSWSVHSGAGTGAYRFVWGMGGENQAFDDMDAAPIATLA